MTAQAEPSSAHPWRDAAVVAALCYGVAAIGGWATSDSLRHWYPALAKPSFNPPNWVFAPVWILLYALIAIAGARLWRRRTRPGAAVALAGWAAQLALNLLWSLLFFGARRIDLALADAGALVLSVALCAGLALRVDRTAGLLLVPYLGWCSFAAALNFAVLRLN